MTSWLIICCETGRERHVRDAIAGRGFEAWLPLVLHVVPIRRQGRKVAGEYRRRELVAIPGAFFARVPAHDWGALQGIKDYRGLYRDAGHCVVPVPDDQITRFQGYLDAGNRRTEQLLRAGRVAKAKGQWLKLQEGAEAIKAKVFGDQEMDAA